jgi:hypothetical protein
MLKEVIVEKMCSNYMLGLDEVNLCIGNLMGSRIGSLSAQMLNSFCSRHMQEDCEVMPTSARLRNRVPYLREYLMGLDDKELVESFEKQMCQKYR